MFHKRDLYILSQDNYVKIGVAKDVLKRVNQLQTGNPKTIFVYAIFHGMAYYENLCHTRLVNDRVFAITGTQNEWFYYGESTESLIKELVSLANKNGYSYTIDNRFKPTKGKS